MKTRLGAKSLALCAALAALAMPAISQAGTVGYHASTCFIPQGSKVAAINNAGHTAVAVTTISAATLAPLDGLILDTCLGYNSSNADIDDSGLEDNVKQVLKMIRQLKQQIAEKQAELAAVAADSNLSPEEARAKASALQTEIGSLQAGLMSAQTSLAKAMKGMSAEDSMKAASLAM